MQRNYFVENICNFASDTALVMLLGSFAVTLVEAEITSSLSDF